MADIRALDATIAALNAQRAALGDSAVDAAIEALRRHALPTPSAAPTRQRLRQVSVLFVDVAGSTHLLSKIGAADADELLGRVLQRFADIVHGCGGQVLRFTGDGLKAAFGSVGMREDEAVHAVRAGLEILQAAADHAQQVQQQLQIDGFGVRVGIHTGAVLLGGGAEAERSAIGHAVHLAARMEQSAPVGRLRISHDTWSQVRGLFRVQPQPPLWVKGHEEPLLTYLVLGAESDPERAVQRGIEGLATPMIGRDVEMQRLLAAFEQSCGERSLRAMTVLADAGVGKTRLRRELLARLSSSAEGMRLLQARAHPDSGLQPYGLLRQLVARWLSIADDLDGESVRLRLEAGLAPWLGSNGRERAQLVGQLIGVDFSASNAVQMLNPRELREQGFAALADLMHALAEQAPLVVALDDLHWADDASLDFVQHLARKASVPLLLVMLARPALLERRPLPLAGEDVGHATLHLQPLDAEQAPALVAALLQHLPHPPEALRRLLIERAAGNPFYMEELVRMLIDDGVIDARRQPWAMRADWQDSARVPATLAGVLQARLHALPSEEITALQHASIVGPVFWDSALAAIDPDSPAALPALRARALVVARTSSAFADTAEHAFQHQLLHDVTYDTVLRPARREGHARAARWLAERVAARASEFLGITAAHFERAGDSAQALDYYDRARENASSRFAHTAALAYIECALRQPALTAPMWHFQLLVDKQVHLESLARLDESAQVLETMAGFAEECDSNALRADVAATRMLWADREGRAAEADALARKAIALAEPARASGPAALAHGELAVLALQRRDFDSALEHTTKGLRWARECAQLHWREGGLLGYQYQLPIIGVEALLQQQRWQEAHAAVTEALAALPPRRRREQMSLLLQRARAESHSGEFDVARSTCDGLAALAASIDIVRIRADAANALAEVCVLQRDFATLERAATEAEAHSRSASYSMGLAMAWKNRGAVAAERGDLGAARALWADAKRQYEEQGMPPEALGVRTELAELDRREGRVEAAVSAVLAVLAEAGGGDASTGSDRRADPWPLLEPPTLLRCHAILVSAGHAHAAPVLRELQRRLQQQLAQLPDKAAQERLVQVLPHWRETARLGEKR
jgi:class 3 adenylate cyclase/tetratricopeptide (TPR) repeat protein